MKLSIDPKHLHTQAARLGCASEQLIFVSAGTQTLTVLDGAGSKKTYSIATAANGLGELKDSECTPRGWHVVRAKIGAGYPKNAVFVSRRFTGEIFSAKLQAQFPERDWILSRILWLSGLEVGKNRLGQVDTMQRYVYIHGSPDSKPLGTPSSRGCINMHNHDVIELFDSVTVGTPLLVAEH